MANKCRTGPPGQTTMSRPPARSTDRWTLISPARPLESMNPTPLRLTATVSAPPRSASRQATTSFGEVLISRSPLTLIRQRVSLQHDSRENCWTMPVIYPPQPEWRGWASERGREHVAARIAHKSTVSRVSSQAHPARGLSKERMAEQFAVTEEATDDDRYIVAVDGEVDLFSSAQLRGALVRAIEAGHDR